MIITSNQVPTAKWNVGGRCVTCISNCALGYNSLNAIDSLGMRTLCCSSAQLSVCPSKPTFHCLAAQAKSAPPPRQHPAQPHTSLNRLDVLHTWGCTSLAVNVFCRDLACLVHALSLHVCNWMQLFQGVDLHKYIQYAT